MNDQFAYIIGLSRIDTRYNNLIDEHIGFSIVEGLPFHYPLFLAFSPADISPYAVHQSRSCYISTVDKSFGLTKVIHFNLDELRCYHDSIHSFGNLIGHFIHDETFDLRNDIIGIRDGIIAGSL